MLAQVLEHPGQPLVLQTRDIPVPNRTQVLVRVHTCGVCRTDLHLVDGELPRIPFPIVPGHEIVGTVEQAGEEVPDLQVGMRIGVPWLGWTCGECAFCRSGRENLCDQARFTGYQLNGGYAEYAVADHRFCFPLPPAYDDVHVAPLLCAGLIGYRSLRAAGDARRIGLYGFGAAAHLVTQLARHEGREVLAFTRAGDHSAQEFALRSGAVWAGDAERSPPVPLDASILYAPVGALIPQALAGVVKGGTVVCAGIHMSDIPAFRYELLWGERTIRSVANLTRADGREFFKLAEQVSLKVETLAYPLTRANEALTDLRSGRFVGAAVLTVAPAVASGAPSARA